MKSSRKTISAIMSAKVSQVSPAQSAMEALSLMRSQSVSSVLVVENQLMQGIITERDIVGGLHAKRDLRHLRCADLMQSPVIAVGADAAWLDAYHLMAGRGIRHLAVTDNEGHVLGVVSEGDMMRNFGVEYYTNFKDVGSVMSTAFCKLPPAASTADALAQMIEQHQSCVIVVDASGHPMGILTERDVVRLSGESVSPAELTLYEVMRSPVITVKPRKALHAAVKAMEEAHIRRLVVTDEAGVVCGLLTHHEVARGMEGDYVTYLKEMVDLQSQTLEQAAQAIDDELLLANILRSMRGTAALACDLEFRISYATPSVTEVLGLRADDMRGADLRDTLQSIGWQDAGAAFGPQASANGPNHSLVGVHGGKVDFQVSALLDDGLEQKGYLVLARKA